MSDIYELLEQIQTAVLGEDVRGSIHDAIEQCYDDATGNSSNLMPIIKLLHGSGKIIEGTNTSSSQSTLVDSELCTQIDSIFLTPGIYLVFFSAIISSNSSGVRCLLFRDDDSIDASTYPSVEEASDIKELPISDDTTIINGMKVVSIQENDIDIISSGDNTGKKQFWLFGYQDCGTHLTFNPNLFALRLSNFDPETEDETISDLLVDLAADISMLESKGLSLDQNDYLCIT